jgi:DUF4097 and DUF4098 domain-containing protein YvlB
MKNRLYAGLLTMVVLLAAVLSAGCMPSLIQSSETYRKTIEAEDGATLEVRNRNGSIEISSWDNDYIDVYAIKRSAFGRSELEKVDIRVQSDGDIIIQTEYLQRNARVSVNYEIRVPVGLEVTKVNSSNGRISLRKIRGDVTAETSNGSIEIRDVNGSVSAKTSNGKVHISGVTGIREVKTSNGSISVEIPEILDDITIRTSNGSIKLYLPGELNADLDLSTSNGKVNTHGLEVFFRSFSNTHLNGKIGEGGSIIQVTTSNGSIDMYKLK